MIVLHELRRRARVLVGPLLGSALTGISPTTSSRVIAGCVAWLQLTQQLRVAKDTHLDQLRAERAALG